MKLHSAIPKEGLFSVEDSNGKRRWVNIGHKVDGYTVQGYNQKEGTLILSNGEKKQSIGLQGGTVFDSSQPPVGADAYVQDPTTQMLNGGTVSGADQAVAGSFSMKGADGKEISSSSLMNTYGGISPENAMLAKKKLLESASPNIKGIHTFDEYNNLLKTGKLPEGLHMVLKNEDGGGIGVDHFYNRPATEAGE